MGAFIRNAVINGTTIDGKHRLHSDISPGAADLDRALQRRGLLILTLGLSGRAHRPRPTSPNTRG